MHTIRSKSILKWIKNNKIRLNASLHAFGRVLCFYIEELGSEELCQMKNSTNDS